MTRTSPGTTQSSPLCFPLLLGVSILCIIPRAFGPNSPCSEPNSERATQPQQVAAGREPNIDGLMERSIVNVDSHEPSLAPVHNDALFLFGSRLFGVSTRLIWVSCLSRQCISMRFNAQQQLSVCLQVVKTKPDSWIGETAAITGETTALGVLL